MDLDFVKAHDGGDGLFTGYDEHGPVSISEEQYMAFCFLQAYRIKIPKGYIAVDFRDRIAGETILTKYGGVAFLESPGLGKHIILEKAEEWFTPTDQDLIDYIVRYGKRPIVEVRDHGGEKWKPTYTLVLVNHNRDYPYCVSDPEHRIIDRFKQCRMLKDVML